MASHLRAQVASLSLLVVAAACDGCPQALPPGWALVRSEEPGALLSVQGADGVVWVVGGDPDGPDGAATGTVLVDDNPRDDDDFAVLDTGLQGDFWWVHPTSAIIAWLSGSAGRVVRIDRSQDPPDVQVQQTPPTDDDVIVFGVYAAADDDVWAVGGRAGGASGGFLWRKQGNGAFVAVPLPVDVSDGALWKVDGRGADDVWIVGTDGLTFHFNGTSLAAVSTPQLASLFTVDVGDSNVVAVGGLGEGVMLAHDGGDGVAWQDRTPTADPLPALFGVHRHGDVGLVVGDGGSVYALSGAALVPEDLGIFVQQTLHACFVGDDGLAWAVGGRLSGLPLQGGVLLRRAD